ncbi:MAG: hypothetical protein JJU05_17720 [Verrucomicrobia bacterium]|nr:hypothetical protein [Verrucomicrobiota bacterium]MCH8528760.1 hypothetical protein [Kiritimatiellia bacterium]
MPFALISLNSHRPASKTHQANVGQTFDPNSREFSDFGRERVKMKKGLFRQEKGLKKMVGATGLTGFSLPPLRAGLLRFAPFQTCDPLPPPSRKKNIFSPQTSPDISA